MWKILVIMGFTKVAKTSEIMPGSMKGYVVGDKKIALSNVGGTFYAFEDRCSHQGQPLAGGLLMGNVVMCLFHGAQFDVTTGKSMNATTKDPVKTFPVKVEGDDILVDV